MHIRRVYTTTLIRNSYIDVHTNMNLFYFKWAVLRFKFSSIKYLAGYYIPQAYYYVKYLDGGLFLASFSVEETYYCVFNN